MISVSLLTPSWLVVAGALVATHSHLPRTPCPDDLVRLKLDTHFYVSCPVLECFATNSLTGELTVDEELAGKSFEWSNGWIEVEVLALT